IAHSRVVIAHIAQAHAAQQGALDGADLEATAEQATDLAEGEAQTAFAATQPGQKKNERHQQCEQGPGGDFQPAPHRSGPMTMCSSMAFRAPSRPWPMSRRTRPTGERQRTPNPTPVRASKLPMSLKALPVSTKPASAQSRAMSRSNSMLATARCLPPITKSSQAPGRRGSKSQTCLSGPIA